MISFEIDLKLTSKAKFSHFKFSSNNNVHLVEKLGVFTPKRLEKTKLINSRSRLNYYSFHLSNPLLVKARNTILKKITKNKKLLNSYLGNIYQQI